MPHIAILSREEQQQFDQPPVFSLEQQLIYFALTEPLQAILMTLKTPTNKVGFMLQWGYFTATHKFYTTEQFRTSDIHFVTQQLELSKNEIDLTAYKKKIPTDHRKKIINVLGWQAFDSH